MSPGPSKKKKYQTQVENTYKFYQMAELVSLEFLHLFVFR